MKARSLAIQSVLYQTASTDVVRAAGALANSAALAVEAGVISQWRLELGDCSPTAVLDEAAIAQIADFVGAAGGEVRMTFFGENLGSAAGHNRLAALTDTDLLLILNPDAQVAPDALTVLASSLVKGVGIAEARQIPFEHPKDYVEQLGDTSWASTACALTTREAFDAVGGFDSETFFLYCDDVDYSWRVRLAGLRVVYAPAAAVFHDKRLTSSGDWQAGASEVYYSAEAAILLAHKYSRPDIVRSLLKQYRAQKESAPMRAVAEYERRKAEGRLPSPIDADHNVAQFIKGNYAVHRF